MSELKALEMMGTALDPATPTPPDRLRQRVLAEAAAEPARTRSSRSRFALPRLGWRFALAGGLAAVLTAGLLVAQVVPFGGQAPASSASAAQILRGAAAQAQRQPAVAVRADQFIYVESFATAMSRSEAVGESEATFTPKRRQIWLSVDGTRDGLIRERPRSGASGGVDRDMRDYPLPGCRDGLATDTKYGKPAQVPCTPQPNYQRDLPTDADGMLAYLYRGAEGTKNPRDQAAFTNAGDLIREAYHGPAVLAAVFNAVARIPGVTVVGEVTDEAGRPGVAVALTEVQGTRTELIFDRQNFGYLGEHSVLVQDQDGLKAGQVLNSTAVLEVAVVDQAGQVR
jgi:hypothetical protein